MKYLVLVFLFISFFKNGSSQASHAAIANQFLQSLSKEQRQKAMYPFDDDERYNWWFVPRHTRNGIWLYELNSDQRKKVFELLSYWVSKKAALQTIEIMRLETVLRELEKRGPDDNLRGSSNYAITFFDEPSENGIWGWRFEGHHVAFNFSSQRGRIQSCMPSFLGANPAKLVRDGKVVEVLKEECDKGFSLISSLRPDQLVKAVISDTIFVNRNLWNTRRALAYRPRGVLFKEMDRDQQAKFLELLDVYLLRYQDGYREDVMKEIRDGGIDNLRFAWAGSVERLAGSPFYYRIHGPTILIELENTENGANHVHTIMRDLLHDFGGDELLEHYRNAHQQ